MRDEQLEQQLAAYAGFLDEMSKDRLPDLTQQPNEIEGDFAVVDLLTRTDEEMGSSEPNGRGGRTPWLVAIAAGLMLIATLAFLVPNDEEGGLRTTDDPDGTDVPESSVERAPIEPAPADVAEVEPGTPSMSSLIEEATSLESTDLLSALYAPDVAVTVDGFEFETGDGFNFATDTGMSELLDTRYVNCAEAEAGALTTMSCDWTVDFTLLAGTVSAQEGNATMTVEDGAITTMMMETTNLEHVVSELSLYRAWVDLGPVPVDDLFTPLGTLWISTFHAAGHKAAAADFIEATDVAADPTNIANVLMAALRSGDTETIQRVFAPLGVWTEPSFEIVGAQLVGALGGDLALGPDLATFDFSECAQSEDAVTCDLALTYANIPGLGNTPGVAEITTAAGNITSVSIVFDEAGRSEYLAQLRAYKEWAGAELALFDPDIVATMFYNDEIINPTPESFALHAKHGPTWSATLSD